MTVLTYRDRRPWTLRTIDRVGGPLIRVGVRPVRLQEDELLTAVQQRTGLDDFGTDEFLPPLRTILSDCQDPSLGFVARLITRRALLQALENRLRIQQAINEQPQIVDVNVGRPIIIASLPRTGTTLLHNLLALDPASWAPRQWELRYPWPPQDEEEVAWRVARIQRNANRFRRYSPTSAVAHTTEANAPDECVYLMRNAFAAPFWALATMPGFSNRHCCETLISEYRTHSRCPTFSVFERFA